MADILSDVLALVDATSHLSVGLVTGGDWSVRIDHFDGLKFNAVIRGKAWLAVDGIEDPIPMVEGDCFILTRSIGFTLASDLSLEATPASVAFADQEGNIARFGAKDDFLVLGGKMTIDEAAAGLLADVLPSVIHVSAGSTLASDLRWLIEKLVREVSDARPGSRSLPSHLMHLMFVEGIRSCLSETKGINSGWVGALHDPRIGRVLEAMHSDPARRWSLPDLASIAGMSRANLALRFKKLVGTSPLEYLASWRMQLASRELRHTKAAISRVAERLGFSSESAFSATFKRHFGHTPTAHRAE
ncbi:AraC family transcriptional regulator [Ensifer adhaerens]|uniref:AraC family transcriptional regulator n=1 Tax=Ensifer adhaerens TaxID=106592 RepID=UPI001CBF062C|nr:AraC family transcriptional regulator [Ensifer adhaerens]MBZ7925023.1 AraC family transcriptional regulator [Ensifer adhaerens]UAX95780.1 AraC family transcriptional regulator [Ensifer adhaerens]UAY04879.1 AraC family transcriptional regulator [Ensifer adhaerens]UAY10311.1 AraC family transcriptional regulator [Ensifer adhaerens]